VGSAIEDRSDELVCFGAILLRPPDNPGWGPFQISLMAFGHMLVQGGKTTLAVVSLMAGYSFIFEEDLHGGGC
jgi:hypothetical protein